MPLGKANTIDLGADQCAVCDIDVLECLRRGVASRSTVRFEKEFAEVMATEKFKVHREKRCVVDGIHISQFVVELEAVEDGRFSWCAEDVVVA